MHYESLDNGTKLGVVVLVDISVIVLCVGEWVYMNRMALKLRRESR